MIRFHPSSVGLLMTDAQSVDDALVTEEIAAIQRKTKRTDEEKAILQAAKDASLSCGAKTYLKSLAKEFMYSYHKVVDTKYMDKGKALEPEAIEFINRQRFKRYTKNTERRVNDFLTGECDIYVPGVKTIDAKVSWDLSTFPALTEDAHDPIYMWQGVSYNMLWPDVQEHEVVFVMLDTPESILPRWEQQEAHLALHRVSHIDPALRITSITYKRDTELEAKLERKCRIGQQYLAKLIERMRMEHGLLDEAA
jgi:hypothetical protein